MDRSPLVTPAAGRKASLPPSPAGKEPVSASRISTPGGGENFHLLPADPSSIPIHPGDTSTPRRHRRDVGSATDSLEIEAEVRANAVARRSAAVAIAAAPPVKASQNFGRAISQIAVSLPRELSDSQSQPLSAAARLFMEPRFERDFSGVRIHSDDRAARWAQDLNADAFTIGQHIFFDRGYFAPDSPQGRQLLAHELAHVEQQWEGRGSGKIWRAPKREDPPAQVLTVPYKLAVSHEMDPAEVLDEFIRQYFGAKTEAEIAKIRRNWQVTPDVAVTSADVAAGFKYLSMRQSSSAYFAKLSKEEKDAVNAEADRRFWEQTKYKPGKKLGDSPEDRKMAQEWRKTRENVLLEDSQKKQIEALPQDVKDALFGGNAAPASPQDYQDLLRIAHKLEQLTAAQRADYLSRVNADAGSVEDVEASIDRYIEVTKKREREDESADKAARPLLGLETLHEEWKQWKYDSDHPLKMEGRGGGYGPLIEAREKHANDYFADLKRLGFANTEAFETAMAAYVDAFRGQTVRFALDQLAFLEHLLFTEKKKLEKPGGAADIAKGIAAQGAAEHFKKANLMESYGMVRPPENSDPRMKGMSLGQNPVGLEREAGKKAVIEGSKDPLVAQPDIDLEGLAKMDAEGVRNYLLQEIESRLVKLAQTRKEFAEDPDRIFTLPKLLDASREHYDIGKNTIYWMVVQDKVDDKNNKKFFSDLAIGIISLALTLLIPGGGLLAAAALVANAGISVYQAYEAYEDYKKASNDYTLGFLDDKPSFGWVVLAVAAAAVDVGLPVAEVFAKSASGLRKLEAPLRAFSEDKNATKLAQRIKEIEDLRPEVARALEQRAKAIEEEKAAWDAAKATPLMAVYPGLGGIIGGIAVKYGKPLFKTIRRGIKSFTALAKDAEFVAAMGDITKMQGAEREAIETAFNEMRQVVAQGEKTRMDEKTLESFVDRWIAGRETGGNFHQRMLDEMKAWKPMTREQSEIASRLARQKELVEMRYADKAEAMAERTDLLAKPKRTPRDVARIRELEADLNKLDPLWQKSNLAEQELDKLRAERRAAGKDPGLIRSDEVTLEAVEKDAEKAQLSLYDRLRAAAPGEKAKEQALKGVTVDQVGPLKSKPTSLQVDHIVSVDEIAEMDGFKELTWKQQKEIVDMKANLVVMDGSANASKSNRTWRSWPQWSTYYDEGTRVRMIGVEDKARGAIQAEIARLRTVPVNP